jgi:hypothetical protein
MEKAVHGRDRLTWLLGVEVLARILLAQCTVLNIFFFRRPCDVTKRVSCILDIEI